MMRPVAAWFGQVVAWAVIVAVVSVLAVAVLVPRVTGATPYTILTGSMRPSFPPERLSWSSRSTRTPSASVT